MSGHAAKALNLLETLADSMAGYDHVGEHAHRFGFYVFCERHVAERAELLRAYQRLLRVAGGQPDKRRSLLGTAHRLFLDFRVALSSGDLAIIEELIRGETFLATRIDTLLEEQDMPPEIARLHRQLRIHVGQSLLDLHAMRIHARQGGHAGGFRPLS